ncbi:MAG: hypothetical protein ACRDQ2_13545 [Gaiellales bacterium]
MRALERRGMDRDAGFWLIDTARTELDERFGPSKRDREVVALHLAGLSAGQIAKLLGYRREAATIAVGRALLRVDDAQELAWAEPEPEFVEGLADHLRAARPPSSGRWMRVLVVAISAVALLVALPAVGALMAGDDPKLEGTAVPQSGAPSSHDRRKAARRARPGVRAQMEHPSLLPPTAARTTSPQPSTSSATAKAAAVPPATPPAEEQRMDCDGLSERLRAVPARQQRALGMLIQRQARERQDFFNGRGRWATPSPESGSSAANMLRERSALEARLYREQEALLERQSRELRRLEAQRKRCEG